MSIAFRKVWRDLWNYKGRTLLVVLSIAVGVMALGMTTASDTFLKQQIASSRAASRPPHARLSFTFPINDDAVAAVVKMPEVAHAEGYISGGLRWKPALDSEWRDGIVTALVDYEHQLFDRLEWRAGAWPGKDQIAVETTHQTFYGVPPIGGTLYVQVNDRPLPLIVSGAVRDPGQLPGPTNAFNRASFYIDRDTAERLLGSRDFNNLRFGIARYDEDDVKFAIDAVQKKLERLGAVSAIAPISADAQDPTGSQVQQFVDGLGIILIVMAAMSLALSVTLVINTINAILAQQITQIGIMKTVGGEYGQIVTLYLVSVAVYGALSLLLAVPLGAVSGYYLSALWLTAFNIPLPPFQILPEAFLYQVLVGLCAPLLAALWPILQGVGISVREAIAAYGLGTGRYGGRWLDRLMSRVQGLPRLAALALRNTFRRAGRVALTEITLICAGAIFMMVVATGESFDKTIASVWQGWGFDVAFVFTNFQRVGEMEAAITTFPDVRAVEMWTWAQAKARRPGQTGAANDYDAQLRGIPDGTRMFGATLIAGRRLDPADGRAVVFNQKLARDMGLNLGEVVELELLPGQTTTWTIVGLVSDIGVGGAQETAFMRREVLDADLNQPNRATVAQIDTGIDTREAQARVREALAAYFKSQNIGVSLSVGRIENQELAGALWALIGGLLQIMTFLVAAVGSIGLSGTLSINVMERRREIGVMRAVGPRPPTWR